MQSKKTRLGWDINTQYIRVSLPEEKQTSWKNYIKEALASTKINTDTLESLIGKLNHAAHVIPPSTILLKSATPFTYEREKMGTTEAPTMALPRSPTVDKVLPTRDYQRGPEQQHSLCQTISNAMVRRL